MLRDVLSLPLAVMRDVRDVLLHIAFLVTGSSTVFTHWEIIRCDQQLNDSFIISKTELCSMFGSASVLLTQCEFESNPGLIPVLKNKF